MRNLTDDLIRALAAELDKQGITKAELARRLGVDPSQTSRYFAPGNQLTLATVERILKVLNRRVVWRLK